MRVINIFRKLLPAMLVPVLLVPVASRAALHPQVGTENMVVSYADLDLSRDEAVVTLYHRLQKAAAAACGNDSHGIGPRIIAAHIQRQVRGCTEAALNKAVQQVNNPRLTNLHGQANLQAGVRKP